MLLVILNLLMILFSNMNWFYLILAGFFEVMWIIGLKYSNGFTRVFPATITIIATLFSIWFLSLSIRTIPIGTAYAIWTSIGIIGSSLAGMLLFSEPFQISRIVFISLILIGILGLKLF